METSYHIKRNPEAFCDSPGLIPKTFYIHQSTIDGLVALIHWLDGFESAGNVFVPGHFELVMMWRTLKSALEKEEQENTQ